MQEEERGVPVVIAWSRLQGLNEGLLMSSESSVVSCSLRVPLHRHPEAPLQVPLTQALCPHQRCNQLRGCTVGRVYRGRRAGSQKERRTEAEEEEGGTELGP